MASFLNNPGNVLQRTVEGANDGMLHSSLKQICRDILSEEFDWVSASDDEIDVQVLTGGLSNALYILSRVVDDKCQQRVIVRLFGGGTEKYIDRAIENQVLAQLSKRGIGPVFHGLFINGRIEGFIDALPLKSTEMCDDVIYQAIAAAVALLHHQDVEGLPKSTEWLWRKIDQFFLIIDDCNFSPEQRDFIAKELSLDKMRQELFKLETFIKQKCSALSGTTGDDASSTKHVLDSRQLGMKFALKQVLCHNDLLCGNLLLSHTPDVEGGECRGSHSIRLIDYEYAAYNYRAFDFANHFCECSGFECDYARRFPTAQAMRAFLAAYVRAFPHDFEDTLSESGTGFEGSHMEAFIDGMAEAVGWLVPASHLFWGAWAVVQAGSSAIDFDYLSYARMRFQGHRLHCHAFLPPSEYALGEK